MVNTLNINGKYHKGDCMMGSLFLQNAAREYLPFMITALHVQLDLSTYTDIL